MFRRFVKTVLLSLLRLKSSPLGTPARSLMVFAPHQDDETLCCGGTIAAATSAGSTVHVVYLTDGGQAGGTQLSAPLAEVRRHEAVNACAVLGVPEKQVLFLGFPDGDLSGHQERALAAVKAALAKCTPEEVFVPARFDAHPDHQETNRLVRLAARALPKDVMIYECPVWALNNWPFVRPEGFRLNRYWLRRTAGVMTCFIRCINVRRDVRAFLSQKREAIRAHKTQFEGGASLTTVSGGEWLQNFFTDGEFYFRYTSRDGD